MVSKKNVTNSNRPILPKLLRVRLSSLECSRKTAKNLPELTAKVTRKVHLALLDNSSADDSCQVVLNVALQGTWESTNLADPVILFSAAYIAKFSYPTTIMSAIAEKWIEDDFYREAIVAAAMPIINLHMYSQLDMMGIATNSRPLGHSSGRAPEKLGTEKAVRRKTASLKLKP